MFEALAIMLWLSDRYGYEQKLWPRSGTPEHMQAMSWCTWAYVTYGSVLVRLHVATNGHESLRHEGHAAAAKEGLNELLGLLDARLAAQRWMLGNDYSLVDLMVGSVIGYSVYLGAPVDAHPHVQSWLKTLQDRPAMRVDA
jgi:GST-like protein